MDNNKQLDESFDKLTPKQLETLNDILSSNEYNTLEKMLMDELMENAESYARLKEHVFNLIDNFDSTEKPRLGERPKKINPIYITSQTSNLNSLKANRLSIIKTLSDLQKDRLDRAFRILNQINKDTVAEESEGGVLDPKVVLNAVLNMPVQTRDSYNTVINTTVENNADDILDSVVIPAKANRTIEKNVNSPVLLSLDLDNNIFVLLDKDDKVLETLTVDQAEALSIVEDKDGKLYCEEYNVPAVVV